MIEKNGLVGQIIVGETPDYGITGEGGGIGDLVEDETGVREASRVVEGIEGNDFTGGEGVEEEASSEHLDRAGQSGYEILRDILIGDGNEDSAPFRVWDGDGKSLNILGRVWDRGARPKPAPFPSLSVVLGYPKSTGIPQVDGLSTRPSGFWASHKYSFFFNLSKSTLMMGFLRKRANDGILMGESWETCNDGKRDDLLRFQSFYENLPSKHKRIPIPYSLHFQTSSCT